MKRGIILLSITVILILCACSSPTEPAETPRAKIVYGGVYYKHMTLDSARVTVDCITCKQAELEFHWETASDKNGAYEIIGTAISHVGHDFRWGCTRVNYLPANGSFSPRDPGPFLWNIFMERQ